MRGSMIAIGEIEIFGWGYGRTEVARPTFPNPAEEEVHPSVRLCPFPTILCASRFFLSRFVASIRPGRPRVPSGDVPGTRPVVLRVCLGPSQGILDVSRATDRCISHLHRSEARLRRCRLAWRWRVRWACATSDRNSGGTHTACVRPWRAQTRPPRWRTW